MIHKDPTARISLQVSAASLESFQIFDSHLVTLFR